MAKGLIEVERLDEETRKLEIDPTRKAIDADNAAIEAERAAVAKERVRLDAIRQAVKDDREKEEARLLAHEVAGEAMADAAHDHLTGKITAEEYRAKLGQPSWGDSMKHWWRKLTGSKAAEKPKADEKESVLQSLKELLPIEEERKRKEEAEAARQKEGRG